MLFSLNIEGEAKPNKEATCVLLVISFLPSFLIRPSLPLILAPGDEAEGWLPWAGGTPRARGGGGAFTNRSICVN